MPHRLLNCGGCAESCLLCSRSAVTAACSTQLLRLHKFQPWPVHEPNLQTALQLPKLSGAIIGEFFRRPCYFIFFHMHPRHSNSHFMGCLRILHDGAKEMSGDNYPTAFFNIWAPGFSTCQHSSSHLFIPIGW